MLMKTDNLQEMVTQAYFNLRNAILDAEKHPDDESYELSEMHANDVYDEALKVLILSRIEEEKRVEQSDELPFPLIVSFHEFVKEFLTVLPADSAMDADLCFQFREQPFQGIVGIWQAQFRPVIESP